MTVDNKRALNNRLASPVSQGTFERYARLNDAVRDLSGAFCTAERDETDQSFSPSLPRRYEHSELLRRAVTQILEGGVRYDHDVSADYLYEKLHRVLAAYGLKLSKPKPAPGAGLSPDAR